MYIINLKKMNANKPKIIKLTKRTKIFIACIFISFFSIIGIGWYNKVYYNEYISNLKKFEQNITDNTGDIKYLICLTGEVWIDSIEGNKNKETFKYVWDSNTFEVLDCDKAIKKMQNDREVKSIINNIKSSQSSALILINNDLKNPPNSLKDCYNSAHKLCESYVNFLDILLTPNGELLEYTSALEEKMDDLVDSFEKFEKQMEENVTK